MPPRELVDATSAREHLATLAANNVGCTLIARAARIAESTVLNIRSNQTRQITRATRDKILAVRAEDAQPERVDATPAREHLTWLRGQGAGPVLIAHAIDVADSTTIRILSGESNVIARWVADKILAAQPGDVRPEFIDATEVREHLRRLAARGMSNQAIADLEGMSKGAVRDLRSGHVRRVRAYTAARLLKVTYRPEGNGCVDATGATRRVRALIAIGWHQRELCREFGLGMAVMTRIVKGHRIIARGGADAITAAYPRLSAERRTGVAADRSRARATRQGWAPPDAWDEDTIDDPKAKPQWQWIRKVDAAETRPLHWVAEAEHLFLGRVSVPQIAKKFELTEQTVRDRLWKNPRCAAILRDEPTAKQMAAA